MRRTGALCAILIAAAPPGSTFYLVVPKSGTREGSYGKTSSGAERPPAVNQCLPQNVAVCP